MFGEWQGELDQYSDPKLKADSAAQLAQSRARYADLLTAMHHSEDAMQPVLAKFHDYVLTLKHDLNAAAIGSLSNTAAGIDANVQDLIKADERLDRRGQPVHRPGEEDVTGRAGAGLRR